MIRELGVVSILPKMNRDGVRQGLAPPQRSHTRLPLRREQEAASSATCGLVSVPDFSHERAATRPPASLTFWVHQVPPGHAREDRPDAVVYFRLKSNKTRVVKLLSLPLPRIIGKKKKKIFTLPWLLTFGVFYCTYVCVWNEEFVFTGVVSGLWILRFFFLRKSIIFKRETLFITSHLSVRCLTFLYRSFLSKFVLEREFYMFLSSFKFLFYLIGLFLPSSRLVYWVVTSVSLLFLCFSIS